MREYKYNYYTDGKGKVIATGSYAGKTVKGYAKADPRDEFNEEAGKKLAAARCNAKIASKRHSRAIAKYSEALDAYIEAQKHLSKMYEYMVSAGEACEAAEADVEKILTTL